jgi:hypothetical protein
MDVDQEDQKRKEKKSKKSKDKDKDKDRESDKKKKNKKRMRQEAEERLKDTGTNGEKEKSSKHKSKHKHGDEKRKSKKHKQDSEGQQQQQQQQQQQSQMVPASFSAADLLKQLTGTSNLDSRILEEKRKQVLTPRIDDEMANFGASISVLDLEGNVSLAKRGLVAASSAQVPSSTSSKQKSRKMGWQDEQPQIPSVVALPLLATLPTTFKLPD